MLVVHNLKIAWRNLLKYKLQTSISILSLTVGMLCFALSALWLRYENQYDTWWPEHDDVYLVQYAGDSGYYMEEGFSNCLSYPDAGRLAEAHPQIELLSRMMVSGGAFKVSPEAEESFNG
ncbi:MAG: ABC transporter permease, partial [Bacteroidaceae bacterium]|nr:ABC transporter permease [Bacteroidaceae bacterium]